MKTPPMLIADAIVAVYNGDPDEAKLRLAQVRAMLAAAEAHLAQAAAILEAGRDNTFVMRLMQAAEREMTR